LTRARLTLLVPAHNEALTLGAALESLWEQARPPEKVVVVADKCTGDTVEVARRHVVCGGRMRACTDDGAAIALYNGPNTVSRDRSDD
jgi:glycosyltransferase involved in cell wall biosynthesis